MTLREFHHALQRVEDIVYDMASTMFFLAVGIACLAFMFTILLAGLVWGVSLLT